MIQFHQLLCRNYTERVTTGIMATAGHGHARFISHDALFHDNNGYYLNDSLVFRISFEHMDPPDQLLPVDFKVTNFSHWSKNKGIWFSSPSLILQETFGCVYQYMQEVMVEGKTTLYLPTYIS